MNVRTCAIVLLLFPKIQIDLLFDMTVVTQNHGILRTYLEAHDAAVFLRPFGLPIPYESGFWRHNIIHKSEP